MCLLVLGATSAESTSKMVQNVHRCEKLQVALLPTVFGVEFCIALAGNLFAMWLLLTRERRNWHTGIVLSCNLAISDLLYVLTLPLLIVYYALEKNWLFGTAMCKMEKFLFTCNLYASIFFIMMISVNRCVALAYPFFARSHVRPAHAKAVSVLIWIVVGVISCPVLKFASVCPDEHNKNKTLCVSYCGPAAENPHATYKMFLAVFGCLVPLLVTLGSYCVVIRVVWKNINITKLEKHQVALMVVSVLVLYAISFVPYHVFQNYQLILRTQGEFVCWVYDMYQVSKGLATVNMCIHPILYMAVMDSMRIVRTFKIETRKASKAVARRKDPMSKLKGQKIVSCRICKGDHWTTRCPYKDTLGPMQEQLAEQLGLSTGDKEKPAGSAEPEPAQPVQSKTGKYVPPSLRDGGTRRGESMQPNRRADDNATIRVTNLSEDTRETDLQKLFRPFGSISRIYLAKDKNTGQSKGFAFIKFHRREDAARAIAGVSGFGSDHLIFNVEWAKPSNN